MVEMEDGRRPKRPVWAHSARRAVKAAAATLGECAGRQAALGIMSEDQSNIDASLAHSTRHHNGTLTHTTATATSLRYQTMPPLHTLPFAAPKDHGRRKPSRGEIEEDDGAEQSKAKQHTSRAEAHMGSSL